VDAIKAYGIKKVVNLDGGWGEEYLRVAEKLKDAGDFFIHFGTVDVGMFEDPTFEKMVYRTIREHHHNGVRGLKFWKVIGLGIKDKSGAYLRPDDERLKCIWAAAAEFGLPVLFHIGDLNAFFHESDETNEYIDTLKEHPEWRFSAPRLYGFDELMRMQENLLEDNPGTTFIIPHVGSFAENLAQVGQWLDRFPNMYIDIADRLNELGRQPYTARRFFIDNADRILFGTDMLPTDIGRYPIYFRFLETFDEYFPYRTDKGILLGDWNIYGIGLDADVLGKIYHDNIAGILGLK
jgi:predicted TIM-barrel fold metal-dependent hydrolase